VPPNAPPLPGVRAEPLSGDTPGVSTRELSGIAAAGVNLAKIVLAITASAIGALLFYLLIMDWTIGSDIRSAYGRSGGVPQLGIEMRTIAQLDQLSSDLNAAERDATSWSDAAQANAVVVNAVIARVPSISAAARMEIAACAPPPVTDAPNRATIMGACIARVDSIRRDALESVQRAAVLDTANEAAERLHEHRTGQHSFWIQAAQLILLNLLLPLLTALFGYVFGTQQAR